MKRLTLSLAACATLLSLFAVSGAAEAHGRYYGGGHYYGGHYYGGHYHGSVYFSFGVPWPGYWWGPGYYYGYPSYSYYYGAPYYYGGYAPPMAAANPPQYVERSDVEGAPPPQQQESPPPQQQNWWYWCQSSEKYYPYVKECAGGFQKVPAQPPASQVKP